MIMMKTVKTITLIFITTITATTIVVVKKKKKQWIQPKNDGRIIGLNNNKK
jgi:hypothetical protein